MSLPRVIVVIPPESDPPPLQELQGEAEFVIVRTAEELRASQPGTEILFLNHFRSELLREVGPGELRWIHTSSIGVDALLTEAIIESELTVTISRDVCERPIAEWVLGVLLMFVKDIRRTLELQRQARWVHRQTQPLQGRRVLLLGPGPVGRQTTSLLRAAGMSVTVVGRTGRDDPELGEIHGLEELDDLLGQCDDLVLALPLNETTRHIIDARRLHLMPAGARLVNVGRGPLVEEAALLSAAQEGHLDAVALDVFEQEPLPPEHPFWTMENVLVSPHMSGDLIGWRKTVVERFATNFRRWQAGEPLIDVVDLSQHGASAPAVSSAPKS